MTTRGCACGCDDPELDPPTSTNTRPSNPPDGPPKLIIPNIAPLFRSTYACMRQPDYLYIGTVYHPDWFVPRYPYEDREVTRWKPGGLFRASVNMSYPPLNFELQEPDFIATDLVDPSYSQLPDNQGWKPGEINYDPDLDEYFTCVREISYYTYGNLSGDTRRYIKSWDWYQHI